MFTSTFISQSTITISHWNITYRAGGLVFKFFQVHKNFSRPQCSDRLLGPKFLIQWVPGEYSLRGKAFAARNVYSSFLLCWYLFLSNERHMKFNTIQLQVQNFIAMHLCSPITTLVTSHSKRIRHVTRIGNMRNSYKVYLNT